MRLALESYVAGTTLTGANRFAVLLLASTDYKPEDLAVSLLRMVAYNIGQIAYLNALRHDLERVFFGGYFIRGQAFTMETISFAIDFWSKGSMKAMYLRHEGA